MRPLPPVLLLLIASVAGAVPPASASSPPRVEATWRSGGTSAPYRVFSWDEPGKGTGVLAAGYLGGAVAVEASGAVRWRFADTTQLADAVAGDLTGDGMPDMALAQYRKRVTVVDGTDGSLLRVLPTRSEPQRVLVADANGDGHLDLYVVDRGSTGAAGAQPTRAALYLGPGLEEAWTFALPGAESWIVGADTGDLDGQGGQDLVFGTFADNVYAVSSLGVQLWKIPLGADPSAITVADGGRTVFVTGEGQEIRSIDARTGVQRWSLPGGLYGFSRLQATDVNGDGTDDAVWGRFAPSSPPTSVDEGLNRAHDVVTAVDGSTGRPLWAWHTGAPGVGLLLSDLDADGDRDVVVSTQDPWTTAGQGVNLVWGLEGSTGRRLWSHQVLAAHSTHLSDMTAVNVLGGADKEIIVSTYWSPLLGLAPANGGEVWRASPGGAITHAIAANVAGTAELETVTGGGDFMITARNAGGDVLWRRPLDAPITSLRPYPAGPYMDVLATAGNRVFRLRGSDGLSVWTATLPGQVMDTAYVDAEGDGFTEIAVAGLSAAGGFGAGLITLLNGTGTVRSALATLAPPVKLLAGDVTGDGRSELFAAFWGLTPSIASYESTWAGGRAAQQRWNAPTPSAATALHLDGTRLLAAFPLSDAVSGINAVDGTAAWSRPFDERPRPLGFQDVTGDGTDDALVLTEGPTAGRRVYAIDGATGAEAFSTTPPNPWIAAALLDDVSGDGTLDLVLGSDGSTFGEGGVIAIDGTTLGQQPTKLWSYPLWATGLLPLPAAGPDHILAFGVQTGEATVALLRPVPAEP